MIKGLGKVRYKKVNAQFNSFVKQIIIFKVRAFKYSWIREEKIKCRYGEEK